MKSDCTTNVRRYEVSPRGLIHDGRVYSPGDVVDLDDSVSVYFLAAGAVTLAAQVQDVGPTPDPQNMPMRDPTAVPNPSRRRR